MERKETVAQVPTIPIEIVSKADLVRVRRELEALVDSLDQANLRKQDQAKAVEVSNLTERFAQAVSLDVAKSEDISEMIKRASSLLKSSPVIHISFASTPNRAFMEKIVRWFRTEIQADILLQVGLQPSIAAGCIVRTPNKQFDLSLRRFLQAKQSLLAEMIGEKQ